MRILIVRSNPDVMEYTDGTYNLQEIGLARALNKLGHKCDVVYSGGNKQKTISIEFAPNKSFNLFYLKVINIAGNGYLLGLDKLIKNYDIIQSGAYDQLRSWIMAKKYSEKLLVYQGPYYSDFNKGYNLKCKFVDTFFLSRYKKMNTCFLTKSKLAADFLGEKGLKNITPIGVGFDLAQMESEGILESEFFNELKGIKAEDNKLLLYIGRMEKRRNILFLLEAVKKIHETQNHKIKMVLIGRGDKEYLAKIWEYINQNNLKDVIIYKERIEQKYLPAIYKLCDVFLLPTKFEIFGMVLLEAMYYGIPVVTTHNGGASILINNGINGIIEEEDSSKWAEDVCRILENNDIEELLGTAAHETIAAQFTWDALAPKFLEAYQKRMNEA